MSDHTGRVPDEAVGKVHSTCCFYVLSARSASFARRQGYRVDEIVEMIEDVG